MMPQTGIEDARVLWLIGLCASILGVGAMSIVVKKADRKNG